MKLRSVRTTGVPESRSGWARFSLLVLAAGGGVLLASLSGSKELAASTPSLLGPDYDQDGVADGQEWVLATQPDRADTDGDGYHDLEELSRQSDPLSPSSIPLASALSVGMFAYTQGGRLNLHTAIYVHGGDMTNLHFQLGVVLKNTPIVVAQATYTPTTKAFFYDSPADPADKILVLEMPIPDSLVLALGKVSIYSKVDRLGTLDKALDVTNLMVDPNGGIVRIEPSPLMVQGGRGVIYRPLGTGSTPSTATSGQICWQRTAVVGTSGTSLVYEIEQASCQDFDSSCSSSSCAATVGGTITLPSPGSLLGG